MKKLFLALACILSLSTVAVSQNVYTITQPGIYGNHYDANIYIGESLYNVDVIDIILSGPTPYSQVKVVYSVNTPPYWNPSICRDIALFYDIDAYGNSKNLLAKIYDNDEGTRTVYSTRPWGTRPRLRIEFPYGAGAVLGSYFKMEVSVIGN